MKIPLRLIFVYLLGAVALFGKAEPKIDALRARAEAGEVAAQVQLASAYDTGRGVPQNCEEAVRWYAKAAEAGDRVAQNNLGSLYQNGIGVPKDEARAVELYAKSAQQGFPMAENSLGMMYDLGLGVAQDREVGNQWYRKAADHGVPEAMLNLGLNYHDGAGVPKDVVEAFKWVDLARFFTQSSNDMRTKWRIRGVLDALRKELPKNQIKEGEKRSHDWFEAYRKNNP